MIYNEVENDINSNAKSELAINLTINDNYTLKLPRIKTEYARKSFMFMGAKVYNELPLHNLNYRCTMNYRRNFVKLKTIRNLRSNLKNIFNDIYLKFDLKL